MVVTNVRHPPRLRRLPFRPVSHFPIFSKGPGNNFLRPSLELEAKVSARGGHVTAQERLEDVRQIHVLVADRVKRVFFEVYGETRGVFKSMEDLLNRLKLIRRRVYKYHSIVSIERTSQFYNNKGEGCEHSMLCGKVQNPLEWIDDEDEQHRSERVSLPYPQLVVEAAARDLEFAVPKSRA